MSKKLCLALGLLIPSAIPGNSELKILWCAWVLTLGFQRLTYATTVPTLGSWLSLCATHIAEAAMWWSFALSPGFRQGLTVEELVKHVATMNSSAGVPGFIVLFGVPLMVLSFLLQPPSTNNTKKNN